MGLNSSAFGIVAHLGFPIMIAIISSKTSLNALITGEMNEERIEFFAIARGTLQKHTRQRNRHHHPSYTLQIALKIFRLRGDISAQSLLPPFHKMLLHWSKGNIHVSGRF